MTAPRRVVARLALPVPAGAFPGLLESLRAAYGPGLVVDSGAVLGLLLVAAPDDEPEPVTREAVRPPLVHRYAIGDPDPTGGWPVTGDRRMICREQVAHHAMCTWPVMHAHPQHVAGNGVAVVAVSDVKATS